MPCSTAQLEQSPVRAGSGASGARSAIRVTDSLVRRRLLLAAAFCLVAMDIKSFLFKRGGKEKDLEPPRVRAPGDAEGQELQRLPFKRLAANASAHALYYPADRAVLTYHALALIDQEGIGARDGEAAGPRPAGKAIRLNGRGIELHQQHSRALSLSQPLGAAESRGLI